VDPRDISIAHHLKAGTNDSFSLPSVRFTNRRIKNHVYAARKTLKTLKGTRGSKDAVFISEHLTKSASDLFYEVRQLLKQRKIVRSSLQVTSQWSSSASPANASLIQTFTRRIPRIGWNIGIGANKYYFTFEHVITICSE